MKQRTEISAQVIGANIRRLRMQHKETQQQLGELLGYGPTTIANYESGFRLPDLITFFRIVDHYQASLEDFVSEYPDSGFRDVHES